MELKILEYIGSIHTEILDSLFVIITKLGDLGAIWIILSLILTLNPKSRKYGIMIALALIINLILGEGILKNLFNRARPFTKMDFEILINPPTTSSFPSGHTASSFAVLGVFIFYIKKHILPVGILALLISFSRIYLQVHYPTDVIAGAILGLLVSYSTVKILTKKYSFFTLKHNQT